MKHQMQHRVFVGAVLLVLLLSQIAFARPFSADSFFLDAQSEHKKLPPVNWVRSRKFDVKHIAINLRFDWEKEIAIGSVAITAAPFSATNTLTLDAGGMIINYVKIGGRDQQFAYDEKNASLAITLDRIYQAGEDVTVLIDYRTRGVLVENTLGFGGGGGLKFIKPDADNPNRRRQIWSQGETDYNRFWFPSYDSPNDFRTSELTATVEKPHVLLSNGALVSRRDNKDGTETFHWKMDTPYANYLTSIVVGEYAEIKGDYQGIPVSTFLYPNEAKDGAVSVKMLPDMVKFFSEKTGVKYPYVKYAQNMAEGFGGGMEHVTATTMTPTMIHDAREMLDGDDQGLQAHELAHQWFGDYVTCREWSEIWLNESFATYFQALWDEHARGRDYFLYENIRSNQEAYFDAWNNGQRRPIVTKYYANPDALFDTYAYPRGGAVLHMLRKHLGDELFFRGINRYLTKHANQPVQTEQLRIAIEEATGESMDWFFDQWLYKMGHPILNVTQNYDENAKKLTLTVKQIQKTDPLNAYPQAEFFEARVDVAVDDKIHQVWMKPQPENVFVFDAASRPKLVSFDHGGALIKDMRFEKPTADLIYQLKNDPDVLGRRWALDELSQPILCPNQAEPCDSPAQIREAMIASAASDPVWQMRRDILETLAGINSVTDRKPPITDTEVIAALTKATRDENSNVRAQAIVQLGRQRDPKNRQMFLEALKDQSYSVIDVAASALARTSAPDAYEVLLKLAETESWHDRIRVAGLRALGELGDRRAVEVGFKYFDKKFAPAVRLSALNLLAATGRGDARIYPLLIESFKKSLAKNDFQGIFSGLQGIARLGDPRGQEAFDLAREKFKGQDNFLGFVGQIEEQFKQAIAPK